MNAAEAAEAKIRALPSREIIDITEGDFVHREFLSGARIRREKQIILVNPLSPAEDRVGITKDDGGFEQKSIQRHPGWSMLRPQATVVCQQVGFSHSMGAV